MLHKNLSHFFIMIIMVFAVSCKPVPKTDMPNPASVFCKENGGMLELRKDAEGGVSGVCYFSDGSECEEWAFFRGECKPASQGSPLPDPAVTESSDATELPALLPIDLADYLNWTTYTNPDYGFTVMFPEDWVAEEPGVADPLLEGHEINLHPQLASGTDLNVRMTFRRAGEDVLLWPTGVGAGEFVPQGKLDANGVSVRRVLFVCPGGEVNAIWYHNSDDTVPNIQMGSMEFGFIASRTGAYCNEGATLSEEEQRIADKIVASLRLL